MDDIALRMHTFLQCGLHGGFWCEREAAGEEKEGRKEGMAARKGEYQTVRGGFVLKKGDYVTLCNPNR